MISGLLAFALFFSPPAHVPDPQRQEVVQMAINFEQFYRAIAEQESSNNYRAKGIWVQGDRAYGKYQIMGANLPSWGRKFLGFVPSPEDFLSHPEWQEKMARGQLKEYWDNYGARGAASAWYSGDPKKHMNTSGQYGGMPSIKSYVDSVLATAARMPSDGSSSGGSSGGGGGAVTTPAGPAETAESYGFVESMLQGIPELRNLFKQATDGGWTSQKFQAALRDTNWFKTTTESERKFLVTQYGDPATAGAMWHTAQIKIQQAAAAVGASIGWDKINEFAYGIMAKGWTDEQLRRELSVHIHLGETDIGGTAGENIAKLRRYGYEMGIDIHPLWAENQAKWITAGQTTLEDGMAFIRQLAKGQYSNWVKQIDSGQTVQDLASPYLKSMATILEIPPGSITLKDPTIMGALQAKDPQTGENVIKPIWQFENDLRGDARWKKTKNAQDSIMQVAHQVLSDFGVKY